jgi:hypothetical protein
MLSMELRNQIKNYALENKGVEICGLLLVSGNSTFIYKCKNISSDKTKFFELSPLDYLRGWQEGKNEIVGMFHSQMSVKPSHLDIINYQNHRIPSYIYSFDADDIIEVTDKHLKYNKYLGYPFEIGKRDCFSLVVDFYQDEKKITIFDYPRKDNWYKENPDIIKDNYQKEGFISIELTEIKEGDILEINNYHFGIYLEKDLFLSHERGKFSNIQKLTDMLKKRITNAYKYNR